MTKNWRITFSVDKAEGAIVDLDFEDYHWEVAMSAAQGVLM